MVQNFNNELKSVNKSVERENEACHGSCLRNTRARQPFPVMTGVTAKKELRI